MFDFVKTRAALVFSVIALVVSGCTSLGFQPLPNVYEHADSNAEKAYATILSFGAVQDTLIEVCSDVEPGAAEADTCVTLITVEQTLRPAVTAAARIGAEYMDIDARIKAVGPDAPADWLLIAASSAGDLSAAFDPIKSDVEDFIEKAGALTK